MRSALLLLTALALLTAAGLAGCGTRSRLSGNLSIHVAKAARTLTLYSNAKPMKTYRIGLGRSPIGMKTAMNDGRTPEGDYYVCSKNRQSRFYLSLGLSYPNAKDAERGLREGRITQAQRDEIARAISKKRTPPWGTPLGGEVFIHGNGSKTDWTLGCIALDDKDVRELYDLVPVGAPVTIQP